MKLNLWLDLNGVTRERLAEDLGVSLSLVNQVVGSAKTPGRMFATALVRYTRRPEFTGDVSFDDLWGLSPPGHSEIPASVREHVAAQLRRSGRELLHMATIIESKAA